MRTRNRHPIYFVNAVGIPAHFVLMDPEHSAFLHYLIFVSLPPCCSPIFVGYDTKEKGGLSPFISVSSYSAQISQ